MDPVELARRIVPRRLRYGLQRWVSLRGLKLRRFREANPLSDVVEGGGDRPGVDVPLAIVRNSAWYHTHYIRACQELGVPFQVVDLFAADWLERIRGVGSTIVLVWPDAVLSVWNEMLKDRLWILEHELGLRLMPAWDELWMYEDKRRMAYWLAADQVPHPRTWVFYDRKEAESFAGTCDLPVVFKTSFGAAATGVRILRSRRQVRRFIARAFGRGIVPGGIDHRDRQWGHILFQEYLGSVDEWRIVRIGGSFLCRLKERRGEFHSGSGVVGWARPSIGLLEFAWRVTERGGFESMAVDIFVTPDGRMLVNELQTVFGAIRESNLDRGAEHRGRWLHDPTGGWRFEPGDFYRNACANLRVLHVLGLPWEEPPVPGTTGPGGA